MSEIKIYTDSQRFYKVEDGFATRLNSNDINDVYIDQDGKIDKFKTMEDMFIHIGYNEINKKNGGKKSRKNRKHKRKSATKRRTARKHAY